jgi:indole-3-glycerol phosphate synthase
LPEAQVGGQAGVSWTPPTGPLGELTRSSRARAERALEGADALEAGVRRLVDAEGSAATVLRARRFADALGGLAPSPVAIIAEIKRSSPSKGVINEGIDAPARAADYVAGGAAALSVLTEPERFGGSLGDLRAVAARVPVPVLRKDFITHRVQLLEAREAGAAAVLLIARALPPDVLRDLADQAMGMGLGVLAEVRSEAELEVALGVTSAVIGVNNRDLETLVIEREVGARLIPLVPPGRIAVYESSVESREDVSRAAALGADAVLVGSVLSRSADASVAVRALAGVARQARAAAPRGARG